MTRLSIVQPPDAASATLDRAAAAIARGEVVAYPTDTMYGLAVDPRSDTAVARLFHLKGRRPDQPAALIAGALGQVEALLLMSPLARRLSTSFWPGPLTLVLEPRHPLAAGVCGAGGRIGVRIPAHDVACAFAVRCGHALTATSANRSGEPATRSPDEVARELPDLDVLLDAGPAPGGRPSTIVDASGETPRLLREGAIGWDRVLESLRSPSPRP